MSRTTVTLVAPNGAKVRTVRSKVYFVVSYGSTTSTYDRKTHEFVHHAPQAYATVVKRTDSADTARVTRARHRFAVVFEVRGDTIRELSGSEVSAVAARERAGASYARR